MAQFVAFDPNVEVLGTAILSYVHAMGEEVHPILAKHDLADVDPDAWYPQQSWLNVLRDLAEGDFKGTLDLVRVGMSVPENASWPPDIDSVQAALSSIDDAYHMNHRGGELGSYDAKAVGDREIKMYCENPYPCDLDYGIIYATARLYLPADGELMVTPDTEAQCRKHGHDSCTYYVTW